LRASTRPKRFLEDTRVAARHAGVLRDRARGLDSTAIYDSVVTQDNVAQPRAGFRKMLGALPGGLASGRWRRCAAPTITPTPQKRAV
jgi:hypothetical protein